MKIMDALIRRNSDKAVKPMQKHILRSSKEATRAVRKAYVPIYVPDIETGKIKQ